MKTKAEFEERWPALMAGLPRTGFSCPKGWSDLVWELIANIELELEGNLALFTIDQVKEKFGSLRFYYQFPNMSKHTSANRISQLVRVAERESSNICLTCSSTDHVETKPSSSSRGWISTQCSGCRDNFNPRTPRSA